MRLNLSQAGKYMKLRILIMITMGVFANNASACNNFLRSSHPNSPAGISISLPIIQELLNQSIEKANANGKNEYADYPVNNGLMSQITSLFYQKRDVRLVYGPKQYESSDTVRLIEVIADILHTTLSRFYPVESPEELKEHFPALQAHLRAGANFHKLLITL